MDFEAYLRSFMSNVNEERRAAEAYLEQLRPHRDELPLELLKVARTSTTPTLRLLAVVLLRKIVCHDCSYPGEDGKEVDATHWDLMTDGAKETVSAELLAAVTAETEKGVRRRLCDTVSSIAYCKFSDQDATTAWPDLWTSMHGWVTSDDHKLQGSALLLFEMLGESIASDMKPHFSVFADIFRSRLDAADAPLAIRVGAARAAISIINFLKPRSTAMDTFAPLLPSIMNVFHTTVTTAGQTDFARVMISVLLDVADRHPTAFKPMLEPAVTCIAGVADTVSFDPDTRQVCVEWLATLADKVPALCRKMPGGAFLSTVLPVLMRMTLEHGVLEPTDAEWEAIDDDADEEWESGEGCMVPCAEEAIHRIGGSLGKTKFLPAILPLIGDFLTADHTPASAAAPEEWKWRFAGLSALSNCSELLDDEVDTHRAITEQVVALMGHASPRVRTGVLGVIGNFAEYKGALYQIHCHDQVAPALVAGLRDTSRRVRVNACYAVTGFTAHLHPDIDVDMDALQPHLHDFFHALYDLASGPDDDYVKEKAVMTMSALAETSRERAAPYYDTLMPGMKALLSREDVAIPAELFASVRAGATARNVLHAALKTSRQARLLKGRALECFSLLGRCVPPEKFAEDAGMALQGIAALLEQTQKMKAAVTAATAAAKATGSEVDTTAIYATVGVGEDDPVPRFMWMSLATLVKCASSEAFAPYLPVFLPPLIEQAQGKLELKIVKQRVLDDGDGGAAPVAGLDSDDEDNDDDEEDGGDYTYVDDGEGRRELKVKTAALEDRSAAVDCLRAIVRHVDAAHIAPHATEMLATFLPIMALGGDPSQSTRAAASAALVEVLKAASTLIPIADLQAAYVDFASQGEAVDAAALAAEGGAVEAETEEEAEAILAARMTVKPYTPVTYTASPEALASGAISAPAATYLNMVAVVTDALIAGLKDERSEEMLTSIVCALVELVDELTKRENYVQDAAAAAAADAAGMALPEFFPLFRQDQLLHLTRAMLLVRRDALQRRSVRISEARVHHDDYDEEALEDMRELENEDAMLVHFAFEVLSNVVRAHRTLYLPVYSGLLAQIVRDMCHPEVLPQDRRLAVFLYDDLLEHCGEEAVDVLTGRHIAEEALPVLLRCAREENEHVRQGSVYGLGVAAENCPLASAAYLGPIFAELNYAVEHPIGSRDTVEDTAVAAIGKFIMRIYPAAAAGTLPASAAIPPRSDVVTAFLLGLPCVHDRVEARTAVSILCALLTALDADVVGTPDAVDLSRATHALHVLAVSFADPLTNTDDLTATMYGALATLKEKLPGEVLGALWGNLAAGDQKALQVLMAGAGKPGSAAALAAGGAGTA